MATKKALILIDIQERSIKSWDVQVITNIKTLLSKTRYALYIESIFTAGKGSIWDKQLHKVFPFEPTISEIAEILRKKKPHLLVVKETKSVFRGDPSLVKKLRRRGITEIHVVGFDTHSCVLATAFDSFDYGFLTFVIESCTGSSTGKRMREHALKILREVNLTK